MSVEVKKSSEVTVDESPEVESVGDLVGGDPFSEAANPPEAEAPASEAAPKPAPAAKPEPIFRGLQKEIADPKELAKYALDLERQVIERDARLAGLTPATAVLPVTPGTAPAEEQNFYATLGEEFILNPKNAVQKLEERISQKILGTVEQSTTRSEWFRQFYAEHDDLVGMEDLVDLTLQKKGGEWKNTPLSVAKKLLAQEVRSRLAAIRGTLSQDGDARELSAKPVRSLSGGLPAPKMSATKVEKPSSLVDELKAAQARRKRKSG